MRLDTNEEIFDVVDDLDNVIGNAPRQQVHALRLNHRAAHILVYDTAGRLYLQQRALSKECSPGKWDTSAAGHLQQGEDYAAAAARELHEELGLPPDTALTPLFKLEASAETGREFVWVYRCVATHPVQPDPVEISDGRWCTPAELETWLARAPEEFTGSFRLIWQRLRRDAR